MLQTLGVLLPSLGMTFLGMVIIYTLIKLLVKYFPDDK